MFQLYYDHAAKARDDILSGLTVALALVPEAVAFAFVAGVHPLVGLYAAFMVGLITSLVGGRPGMISGATGALAVVMVALVADHGVQYLFATVVLMGLLQITFGLLKLGKFIRMVPYPVLLGFVNGLAIVIFLAQLGQFQVTSADGITDWMSGAPLYIMLGLVLLTMLIMHFLPKFTRALPAGLVAIVVVSLLAIFGGLDTKSVGDIAKIGGGLPPFHIPAVPFNLEVFLGVSHARVLPSRQRRTAKRDGTPFWPRREPDASPRYHHIATISQYCPVRGFASGRFSASRLPVNYGPAPTR